MAKIHGGFQGGGGFAMKNSIPLCLAGLHPGLQLYGGEAKCAPSVGVFFSAQLWESMARIASRMLWVLCAHLCVHWLCVILWTCLCLLASPENPQLCLLPQHVLDATCSARVCLEGFTLPMNWCLQGWSLASFGAVCLLPLPCLEFAGCVAGRSALCVLTL